MVKETTLDFDNYFDQWKGEQDLNELLDKVIRDQSLSDLEAKNFLDYLIKDKGLKINPNSELLHKAAGHGRVNIVKFLVQGKYIDINSQVSINKCTPLHKAVVGGSIEIVEFLIGEGADTKIKNHVGETPLHYAVRDSFCQMNRLAIATLLISEKGDELEITSRLDETPLHYAVYDQADIEVVKLLVTKGANISAKDKGHLTPLHAATRCEQWDAALWLLEKAPEYDNTKDLHDKTPLDYVLEKGDHAIAERFVRMQLINDLNQYIKNITPNKANPDINNLEDFKQVDFRISFFQDSQAKNRRANYRLALEMIKSLQEDATTTPLSSIFDESNIENLRKSYGATRGIYSNELNEIINQARAPIDHSDRSKIYKRM